MKLVLVAAVLVAWTLSVQARIDETFEECENRYGTAVSHDGTTAVFVKDGIVLRVTFLDGKAAGMYYRRTNNAEFTDANVIVALYQNSQNRPWQRSPYLSSREGDFWDAEDGRMDAVVSEGRASIDIRTQALRDYLKKNE